MKSTLGWAAAEMDFQQVRELQADHPWIDWYEGRLLVESGQAEEGVALLTRFLKSWPNDPGAYRERAEGRIKLGQALMAAQDFQSAIDHSEAPSPALYRSLVLSLVAAGRDQAPAAVAAVKSGVDRFPREVTLLGLGVDLALAQSDTRRAQTYMEKLPKPLYDLPQWKFRQAIWRCIEGDNVNAASGLTDMLAVQESGSGQRAGTWEMPVSLVRELAADTRPEKCANAAWETLTRQQP